MEATASAKYLRGSAQKGAPGDRYDSRQRRQQGVGGFAFCANKRAALGIEKCMRSAIANANEAAEKANISIDPDDLWVKAAYVDRGPTKNRRRVRPAPQGRAYREQRHFCHVTILLSNDERSRRGMRSRRRKRTVRPPGQQSWWKAKESNGGAVAHRHERSALPRSRKPRRRQRAAAESEEKPPVESRAQFKEGSGGREHQCCAIIIM